MALWYVLYAKTGCPLAERTRELLQVMGCDYYEETIAHDDEWPHTVVFLEEDYIGDYFSLRNHFKRKSNGRKSKSKSKEKPQSKPKQARSAATPV